MTVDQTYRERALQAEARVADLEAELAAWRELRDVGHDDPLFGQVIVWLGRRVATHRTVVGRLLVFLLRHPGVVIPVVRLADAVTLKGRDERECDHIVAVAVCYARQVLRRRGLADAIETYPRCGYRLSPDAVAPLMAQLAEGGA